MAAVGDGVADEAGEDVVDGDGVGEGVAVRDGEHVVAAVAQRAGGEAFFGGEDGGAGAAEHVVHGRGAAPDRGVGSGR